MNFEFFYLFCCCCRLLFRLFCENHYVVSRKWFAWKSRNGSFHSLFSSIFLLAPFILRNMICVFDRNDFFLFINMQAKANNAIRRWMQELVPYRRLYDRFNWIINGRIWFLCHFYIERVTQTHTHIHTFYFNFIDAFRRRHAD